MENLKTFDTEALQTAFRMGEDYKEPHVSCLSNGSNLKYNRNYMENLGVEVGCTNPLPDKVLIVNDPSYGGDIMDLDPRVDTSDVPKHIYEEFGEAYVLSDETKKQLGGLVFDTNKINENVIENHSNINFAHVLGKITSSIPTITFSDHEAIIYVGHHGSGTPQGEGSSYGCTNALVLKIGNDYYLAYVYTPD